MSFEFPARVPEVTKSSRNLPSVEISDGVSAQAPRHIYDLLGRGGVGERQEGGGQGQREQERRREGAATRAPQQPGRQPMP